MTEVRCDGCGRMTAEENTYFGTPGTVCASCHFDEERRYEWAFRRPGYDPLPSRIVHVDDIPAESEPEPEPEPEPEADAEERCDRCGDPFGDAGPYHDDDGSGFVCVVCAHS
ncbi:MAG: hypothetical protein EP330_07075 [Deltaproteobacteria bacterium]|nr:MAG: hypothetical protein EP330_07075 [Deltaproteobacteria bacterium]